MIDIGVLASTIVTSFLLPHVKTGMEKIAEKVLEKIGDETGNKVIEAAQTVWVKVKNLFSSDEKSKITFEQFEQYPEETKALIETLLKQKLQGDQQLAEELNKLINAPQGNKQTNAQIMNAGIAGIVQVNSISGSNIQVGGVIIGSMPDPKKPSDD